jgi:hypothetical protein
MTSAPLRQQPDLESVLPTDANVYQRWSPPGCGRKPQTWCCS